jgi:hypothetical protein
MLESLTGHQSPTVILIGEVHDDKVAHELQMQILMHCATACRERGRRLVLSLEMFESDVQGVLDEYVLRRGIREEDMLQDARPWNNYQTDYRPLVEFCREFGIRVVASNAPRRYISLMSRGGSTALEALFSGRGGPQAFGLPQLPLPPASASYRAKFVETIASQMPEPGMDTDNSGGCPYIGFRGKDVREVKPELFEAQLLWDHSMALSLAKSMRREVGESEDPLVVHICGAFHCSHGLGIPEVLPHYSGERLQQTGPGRPWLPMDSILPDQGGDASGVSGTSDTVGAKPLPPGVASVIIWPAAVAPTLAAVHKGLTPRSIGLMGDWVVITEESWQPKVAESDTDTNKARATQTCRAH